MTLAASIGIPATAPGRVGAMAICTAGGPSPTTVNPSAPIASPCSMSRSTQRCNATAAICGSTPRSKRLAASLGSLCRRTTREIDTGSQCAASRMIL